MQFEFYSKEDKRFDQKLSLTRVIGNKEIL